jgi:hypothetical protein
MGLALASISLRGARRWASTSSGSASLRLLQTAVASAYNKSLFTVASYGVGRVLWAVEVLNSMLVGEKSGRSRRTVVVAQPKRELAPGVV